MLVDLLRYLTRPELIGVLWVSCAITVFARLTLGRAAVGVLLNAGLLALYAAFVGASAATSWEDYVHAVGLPAVAGTALGLWVRVVDRGGEGD